MKKLLSVALILTISVLQSCKKETSTTPTVDEPNVTNTNDIKVPQGFTWESSRNVNVKVAITDARFGSANHTIAVYDGNPYNGGNLLAKGTASTTSSYENVLYVSSNVKELYLVKTSPDDSRIINKFDISNNNLTTSFSEIDRTVLNKNAYAKTTAIDCNTGCTNTISTNTNNVSLNTNDVLCITGSNITVNFSGVNNATIKICGSNVTLQNINPQGASSILISSTGSVNLTNFNINSSTATFQNDGTVNYTGNASMGGTFINNGTINAPSDFDINSNTTSFTNNGTMNVSGSFNFLANQSANIVNNGTLLVSNNFQHNSQGTFINKCKLVVNNNFNQTGITDNQKYISVGAQTNLNGGELKLTNGAMFVANSFMSNVKVGGYGSTSLMKITGSVTTNGNSEFNGNLQVCSNNAITPSRLTNGATTGCTLYIPTDNCNTAGNGTPSVTDTDGDGVPNNTDEYPNDPNKAYNNYWPSSTTMGTAAFEDQWPSKGDFDLNDLVISYRYKIVTNASNVVVEVGGTYKLFATGGSFLNGFGVQFPVDRSKVSGLTFGTLEQNQTKAVVLLFNNMRNEMANWNTEPSQATSNPVDYSFTFNVANGPSINNFGLSGYNPFIWNAGDSRGKETHLAGDAPTDLANSSLFGTADDNSNPSIGRYYVTGTGLPYAIEIPSSPFKYPKERIDITQAYLKFANWAQSGGQNFTDWFSNTASGYRDNSKIFNP